jgi:DNA-binding NarL/FixJ family response regulator
MSNHTRPLRIVLVGDEGDGDVVNDVLNNVFNSVKVFHCVLCHARRVGEMLSLSSENEFDVIFLDLSAAYSNNLVDLERICEAFSRIPVIVLVERNAEAVRQRALRIGALEALTISQMDAGTLTDTITAVIKRKAEELKSQRELYLEQALTYLQQHSAISRSTLTPELFGMKPLCEAMPYKFLELAKSYSNLIELALSRGQREGVRFSGHSVSQKLHYLASDLGELKAGVWDVIDIHAKAVEQKLGSVREPKEESHKILLELISNLVSYYRKTEYANA